MKAKHTASNLDGKRIIKKRKNIEKTKAGRHFTMQYVTHYRVHDDNNTWLTTMVKKTYPHEKQHS